MRARESERVLDEKQIAERLQSVRETVAAAERRARRAPGSVRLILASKTQPAEAIRIAYVAGARDFGENYVREAVRKRAALDDLDDATWHLIGHLQTNKAGLATRSFDLIQTLDSERLAIALARTSPDHPMPVLTEVNLGGESTKAGVAPDELERLIEAVRERVHVRGLMTIPPPVDSPEGSRPYFRALRELRDRVAGPTGLALSELSMGMTNDFHIAIEEGATMVRVGRAVFGERVK